MKTCTKCGLTKPLDEFRGVGYQCNHCKFVAHKKWCAENVEQMRALRRKAYWKDPAKARAEKRAYGERNRAKKKAKSKVYREQNVVKIRAKRKRYAAENPEQVAAGKRRAAATKRLYWKEHPEEYKAYRAETQWQRRAAHAKRRSAKRRAVPGWADMEAIKAFYAACPPDHHVDHIIPLLGKNVCGLHVVGNLQYLPAIENMRKGNKLREAA